MCPDRHQSVGPLAPPHHSQVSKAVTSLHLTESPINITQDGCVFKGQIDCGYRSYGIIYHGEYYLGAREEQERRCGGRRIVGGQLQGCESLIVCVRRRERSFVSGRFSEFCYAFASSLEYYELRDELFALPSLSLFSVSLCCYWLCVMWASVWFSAPLRTLHTLCSPLSPLSRPSQRLVEKRKRLLLFVWLRPGSQECVCSGLLPANLSLSVLQPQFFNVSKRRWGFFW